MLKRIPPLLALLLSLGPPVAAADEVWEWSTGSDLPLAIEAFGDDLFIAQKSGGLLVLRDSSDGKPVEAGRLPKDQLANLDAMNFHREGDLLYVALGDHFAAAGSKAGLAVVDVSDPSRPKTLSAWTSAGTIHGASDVAVADGLAYLAVMHEGLRILDVSDPDDARLVGMMLPDIDFPKPNPNTVAFPHARGLAIAGGRLYVANDAGGLRILDMEDARRPREIGKYANPGVGEKPQAYNNVAVSGALAYLAVDYCGVEIVDVSDPANMRQVAWWNPWGCEKLSNVWLNSGGHTNGLELDERSGRLYVSGGDSDLIVLDVSQPAEPRLVKRIGEAKDGLGTWDVAVRGRRIYGAYLRAVIPFSGRWAGVKAFNARRAAPVRARRRR